MAAVWAAPSAGYTSRPDLAHRLLLRRRWIPAGARITMKMTMQMSSPRPVVHLELHTGDQARASAFYANLLGWRRQLIQAGRGSYLALELGGGFCGGIVECDTARPLWLPYVEVDQIEESTEQDRKSTRLNSSHVKNSYAVF